MCSTFVLPPIVEWLISLPANCWLAQSCKYKQIQCFDNFVPVITGGLVLQGYNAKIIACVLHGSSQWMRGAQDRSAWCELWRPSASSGMNGWDEYDDDDDDVRLFFLSVFRYNPITVSISTPLTRVPPWHSVVDHVETPARCPWSPWLLSGTWHTPCCVLYEGKPAGNCDRLPRIPQ